MLAMFDGSKVMPFDQSRADRTRRYRGKPITRSNRLLFALNLDRQELDRRQGLQDRLADLNARANKLMTEITSSQMPTRATPMLYSG